MSVTQRKEQGAIMGINATFKSIGSMFALIAGGYLLNEGMKGIITYGMAFTYLFGIGMLTIIIALGLIVYFLVRSRQITIPATPSTIPQ